MESAWPFLIGRSRLAGQRVVIAPGCLAPDVSLHSLERLARGESQADEAYIEDIGPLGGLAAATAIFRVFPARRADFFASGDEVLTDRGGREIRLAEGIVILLPAVDVRRLGLTGEDLLLAHEALVPFYREFWEWGERYPRQYASRIEVGEGAGTALHLRSLDTGTLAPEAGEPAVPAAVIGRVAHERDPGVKDPVKTPPAVAVRAEVPRRSRITTVILAGMFTVSAILAIAGVSIYLLSTGGAGHPGSGRHLTSRELSQKEATAQSNASSAGLPSQYQRGYTGADYLQLACAIADAGKKYTDGLYDSLVNHYESRGESQSRARHQVQSLQGMKNGLNLTSGLCDAAEQAAGKG